MFLDFSNEDVILYMLSENKHLDNPDDPNNEQVNNSINNINTNDLQQGFNIFMQYGYSPEEIRALRMIYHLSALRNSLANGRHLDMSLNAMYQRENNWLGNINQNNQNNNNHYINMNRRNYIRIHLNDNNMRMVRRRRRIYRNEPNISILQGFMIGILLNIFSIFVLMIVRYRPKFKLGVLLGMVFSVSCMILMSESTNHIKK